MTHKHFWLAAIAVTMSLLNEMTFAADEGQRDGRVFGEFVGSSPATDAIRALLPVPETAISPIRWKLTLYLDPKTQMPASYKLHCDFSLEAPDASTRPMQNLSFKKEGLWTKSDGTKADPDATVYNLNGALSLVQFHHNILHVLNSDRSLMVGNAGWSYTLNRTEAAENAVIYNPAIPGSSVPRQNSPPAKGPSVFAILEGRTPFQGVAREMKIPPHPAGTKLKWSITLFQNPETREPTTYKIESTVHRQAAREGKWAVLYGTSTDPKAVVFRLDATATEAALFLQKGDENVFFFLNGQGTPMVGSADYSYTLHRRLNGPASSNRLEE